MRTISAIILAAVIIIIYWIIAANLGFNGYGWSILGVCVVSFIVIALSTKYTEDYDRLYDRKFEIKMSEKRHQLEKQQIADELRRKQEIKELKKLYEN